MSNTETLSGKKTVIAFNVYFSPNSFGGGTIVAEEVAKQLLMNECCEIRLIFVTVFQSNEYEPYSQVRYVSKGIDVIAINIPENISYIDTYRHDRVAYLVDDIVRQYQPEVAHIHCIQNIGASFIDVLEHNSVKILVSIHDCWWLADNQFLLNKEGKYCFQGKLTDALQYEFTHEPAAAFKRLEYLSLQLSKVDKYLFPSEFQQNLHIENGFDPDKCFVNMNGVSLPLPGFMKKKSTDCKVRFGFVGGPGPLKGSELIRQSFESLTDDANNKYELHLVDSARNINRSWSRDYETWNVNGVCRIVDGYTQDSIDEFFSNIDVLLFPSLCKESFGLTVREALVRNVWVIATDGGGTAEQIVEGVNGNIIPISIDSSFLREKIVRCMNRDWSNYVNPLANEVSGYKKQARELVTLL